jgi:hypothetical protein
VLAAWALQFVSGMSARLILALLGSAFLSTACSGGDDAPPPDANAPADPSIDPPSAEKTNDTNVAPPPPASPPRPPVTPTQATWKPHSFPTVRNRGGNVIAQPHIVPIVYSGDQKTDAIGDFTRRLAGSKYWSDMTAEYGIGAMTAADPLVVDAATAPTSTTSEEIEQWLPSVIDTPDPSTLYAIYMPAGASVRLDFPGGHADSCTDMYGYHSEVDVRGTRVGYAVMLRCTTFDDLTSTASHEYLEWATDPFPFTAPAFTGGDDAHWAFGIVTGAELGDRCYGYLDQTKIVPAEVGYHVQRAWSNALSLAGKFPCSPGRATPYVQAIPDANDDITVTDFSPNGTPRVITTKGIRVAPGQSRTVDLHVWSDDPTPRRVQLVADTLSFLMGTKPVGFSYTLDGTSNVGSTMKLTIQAPATKSEDIVTIIAILDKTTFYAWPVLVTNDDAVQASQSNGMAPRLAFITPAHRPAFVPAP